MQGGLWPGHCEREVGTRGERLPAAHSGFKESLSVAKNQQKDEIGLIFVAVGMFAYCVWVLWTVYG